jgi:ribonuclease R
MSFMRGDVVQVQLLRVNPLRGEADFAILRKISDNKKMKAPKQSRAQAAEMLGWFLNRQKIRWSRVPVAVRETLMERNRHRKK